MTKQKDLMQLAVKGGNNADLVLLNKIHELENQVADLEERLRYFEKLPLDRSPDDLKVEKVAMKLAAKLATLEKGNDGHTPTEQELLTLIKPLIPIIPKVKDGHTPSKEELLDLIKPLIPKVQDGKTPTKEELIALITSLIKPYKEELSNSVSSAIESYHNKYLEKDLLKNGTTIRDALEKLKDNERLDKSAIKGLEEALKSLDRLARGGGGRLLGGVLNVGVRVETPVGTVNGTTTSFKVFKVPKWIVIDGVSYFENNGFTLSGKTMTTTIAPVGFIRSFF